MRANLRGLDVLVPEDLLDETDIGSVLVHVRSHAVPQEMAGSHLAGLRSHDVLPRRPRQMIAAERFALGGQEHCEVVRFERELGPRFRDVFLEPRRRAFPNRHVAIFLAFALAHHDQPTVALQIEQFQIHDLQTAQPGCIDHSGQRLKSRKFNSQKIPNMARARKM